MNDDLMGVYSFFSLSMLSLGEMRCALHVGKGFFVFQSANNQADLLCEERRELIFRERDMDCEHSEYVYRG